MASGQQRGSEQYTRYTHRESAVPGGNERLAEFLVDGGHGEGRMKVKDLSKKGYQEAAQRARMPHATQGQEEMGHSRGAEGDSSVDQRIDIDESTG